MILWGLVVSGCSKRYPCLCILSGKLYFETNNVAWHPFEVEPNTQGCGVHKGYSKVMNYGV